MLKYSVCVGLRVELKPIDAVVGFCPLCNKWTAEAEFVNSQRNCANLSSATICCAVCNLKGVFTSKLGWNLISELKIERFGVHCYCLAIVNGNTHLNYPLGNSLSTAIHYSLRLALNKCFLNIFQYISGRFSAKHIRISFYGFLKYARRTVNRNFMNWWHKMNFGRRLTALPTRLFEEPSVYWVRLTANHQPILKNNIWPRLLLTRSILLWLLIISHGFAQLSIWSICKIRCHR